MIRLSSIQRKNADRVAGILLMLPWPAGLPSPRDIGEGAMRLATPAEREAAWRALEPQLNRDGLRIRSVRVTWRLRPRNLPDGGLVMAHLAVEISSFRFHGATDRPAPTIAWAQA